jgi:hypothetical protein
MGKYDRREFLQAGGIVLASTHPLFGLRNLATVFDNREGLRDAQTPTAQSLSLCNTNLQTAIGLGDKTPGVVDGFGQLDSKNAKITWDVGEEAPTSSGTRVAQTYIDDILPVAWDLGKIVNNSSRTRLSQTLAEGYLPAAKTEVKTADGLIRCSAYALNSGCECFEIEGSAERFRVQIWFPHALSVKVNDGIVTSNGQILAVIPAHSKFEIAEAKYNLLSPTRDSRFFRVATVKGSQSASSDLAPALKSGRSSHLSRPLKYAFPAQSGKAYHVVLGLNSWKKLVVRLSVNDSHVAIDTANLAPGQPYLHEFVTKATSGEIVVVSEVDSYSPDLWRSTLLNAIWVFERAVNLDDVKSGALSRDALVYIPCGEEPAHDASASLTLLLTQADTSKSPVRIYLPYDLDAKDSIQCKSFSAHSASDVKERWDSLLSGGAEFITSDDKLDNLYKTSLINILLLRTRYAGIATGGDDLYVVKPGATRYDAFWYRDGAHMVTALEVAGLANEAEKSLRLFWESGLPGDFAALGQQQNGAWQVPAYEYDAQGQALWALCSHFKFTGDEQWLRQVYPSIRKGVAWIKEITDDSKFVVENGERPPFFGLLPAGYGEAITDVDAYQYYHNFWTIFGLRMAIDVTSFLGEKSDLKWMNDLYVAYRSDLLASVKSAFDRVGEGKYIPPTPYQPLSRGDHHDDENLWGSMAALYPTRFLKPTDPMMAATLETLSANCCQEDELTYSPTDLWTYITVDLAMCYLLRDDLVMFHRYFDGFVRHASATNAWAEGINLDFRLGFGDMPHGWAAAQYVHIHRNALVFEDDGILHLCWGAKPAWLEKGIHVKNAPTEFGSISLDFKMSNGELTLDYRFLPKAKGEAVKEIRLHIPPTVSTRTIRVNGKVRTLGRDERQVRLN